MPALSRSPPDITATGDQVVVLDRKPFAHWPGYDVGRSPRDRPGRPSRSTAPADCRVFQAAAHMIDQED
jgi:hypothetical protein